MQKLILLHGAIGSRQQLQKLSESLSTNFEVQTFNFSGHGGEPFANDFSIAQFANELLHFVQTNYSEPVNIFGYSMGGYVALYAALQKPSLFSKIITFATKYEWNNEIAAKETKLLVPEKIEEKIPAFAKKLEERHAPNNWKLVLHRTQNLMIALAENPLLNSSNLSKIKTPVMVLLGDSDEMVTLQETKLLADSLPFAQLKILQNTKHHIEKLDIELSVKLLVDFFEIV